MAQTRDGYLWLASEHGLFRFDGVKFTLWRPPADQKLPDKPYSLLVSRDGTLWIGTFAGLVSWNGIELTNYPDVENRLRDVPARRPRRNCVGRHTRERRRSCAEFAADERSVTSRTADSAGLSGVWRRTAQASCGLARIPDFGDGNPDRPNDMRLPGGSADLITSADGELLIGIRGAGLKRFVGDKIESYPVRSAVNPAERIPDHDVKSNKLLRDRNGGIWIGTDGLGLIHVKDGKADMFTKADGPLGQHRLRSFRRSGRQYLVQQRERTGSFSKVVRRHTFDATRSIQRCHEVCAGVRGRQCLGRLPSMV